MPRKTPLKKSFGNRIKELRIKNNLTQTELGEKINVGKTTIANYESGYSEPDNDKLICLANIFNVSLDFLLGITTYQNPKEDIEDKLYSLNLSNDDFLELTSMIKNKMVPNSKYLFAKETDNLTKACKICSLLEFDYTPAYHGEEGDEEIKLNLLHKKNHEKVRNILLSLDKKNIVHDLTKNENKATNNGSSISSTSSAVIFVYGSIPAGVPMECIEDIIDTEEISSDMLRGGKEYFGLKIKGDSMEPEYLDGDVLILQKVSDCENGEDCVVMVNGDEGTFKRVFKNENGVILQPLNNKYQPLIYSNEQIENLPVKIIGVVRELRRKK